MHSHPAVKPRVLILTQPRRRRAVDIRLPRAPPSALECLSAVHAVDLRRQGSTMNSNRKSVAVVVGATSKWQADGRNTLLAHGKALDDSALPVGVRWGIGGAIAQKFAQEGFVVVLTTRHAANASALEQAIRAQGGTSMIVELDLVSQASVAKAFATIRERAGDPEVLIYNAGYLEGRDLPPEKELLEHIAVEMFDT